MANDELFSAEGGDKPDKPNILIVPTDGRPKLPGGAEVDFNVFKDLSEKIKVRREYLPHVSYNVHSLFSK